MQISLANAAQHPHVDGIPNLKIPNLDSQFGAWWFRSPQNFNKLFLVLVRRYPGNFIKICLGFVEFVMAGFPSGQSTWWSLPIPKSNHVPFTTPGPSMKFHCNSFRICWVMPRFPIGQSAWWSRLLPNVITCYFYHHGSLEKISSQSVHNFFKQFF